MKNSISFFDFDGTLTRKDSLLEFIKFYKGNLKTYLGILFLSPYLLAMKGGMLTAQQTKEKLLTYFLKGEDVNIFNAKCEAFADEIIPHIMRKDAVEELQKQLAQKQEICIVTASAENWVTPYFNKMGINVLGTRLQIINDKITGKITGQNCKGAEKVERIKTAYDLSNYDIISAYGDTSGDKEMLAIATRKFYRHFKG